MTSYINGVDLFKILNDVLSLKPQPLSHHANVLEGLSLPNITTSIHPSKSICYHTRPDGTKFSHECESNNAGHLINNPPLNETVAHLNHSKEKGTNLGNTNISKSNVTTINSVKHICNGTSQNSSEKKICSSEFPSVNQSDISHLQTNLSMLLNSTKEFSLTHVNSSTGSTEIASLNDKSHKYSGGMDVDEKFNLSTSHGSINSLKKNDNSTNNKSHGRKSENNDSNAFDLQRKDSSSKTSTVSTKAAGIAAGICILVASAAYISLMVWRRLSQNHYGNREMLINEDDLGDIHDEDMRHFEAACIQIET